jgi:2-(1,2-epoxy-1,2-dihydrophenyl)acetyl-CoA isomerase
MNMTASPVVETFDAPRGIACITFNRPDVLNAIDVETADAFCDAVLRVTVQDGLRCVVLAGVGRAFSAGGDVAGFTSDAESVVNRILDSLHPAITALRACPAPVLAVVQGVAAGAGLSIALGADFVLASDNARFVVAYDRIGGSPDCGGTWFLPRRVGRGKVFAMMLLSQIVDAPAALAAGIVSEVVPHTELDARAEALARKIAAGPTAAFGHFKRLVDGAYATPLDQHLENERAAFIAAARTKDFKEGVSAFVQRRDPQFDGR